MISVGQIVFSKNGRDKGKAFVIINISSEYVFLADGKLRVVDRPKKKKLKHIQLTKFIDQDLKNKLLNAEYTLDSDIRKVLLLFGVNRCKEEV
ncbi:MAG: KOW domain-containing RNA-binding protein [Clostridiales bacterium]|jgi:ribosomal protein L14E/L6E/L27E|nr:KOW domain-containing RNA-binding protein [Clostridiales bacterium]